MSHCNKRRGDLPSLPIWSTGKKGSFKHNHCLCLTNVYLSVSCGIFYIWFNPFGEKRFLKIIYVVQCSWVHLPFTEFLKATLRCNGQKLQNCAKVAKGPRPAGLTTHDGRCAQHLLLSTLIELEWTCQRKGFLLAMFVHFSSQ